MGFRPTTPHNAAGHTIDPSVSVPTARGARPAATAAADPDDEPPAERSSACGLTQSPPTALQPDVEPVDRKFAHSDRLVLPRTMAPAARSRVTSGASVAGPSSHNASEPAVVPIGPAVSMLSLTRTGTPWRGPRERPAASSASRRAASSAASGLVRRTDRSVGPDWSTSAIRRCSVSMRSLAVAACEAYRWASVGASVPAAAAVSGDGSRGRTPSEATGQLGGTGQWCTGRCTMAKPSARGRG